MKVLKVLLVFMFIFTSLNINVFANNDTSTTGKLYYNDIDNSLFAEMKGVTLATSGTKYRTIGWKFTIYTSSGPYTTLMKVNNSNFYPVGSSYDGKQDYEMKFKFLPSPNETSTCEQNTASCVWNRSIIDNFMLEYASNPTAQKQITGLLINGGTIQADAIMTTVVNGTEKGSIRDNAKWKDSNKYSGTVYDTQGGILGAASWSQAAKNDIYTKYYNLLIDFPELPVPITGELITRYFEIDSNNKVVSKLQTQNEQTFIIPDEGIKVTAPYVDFSGVNYKGYNSPTVDNVGVGSAINTFKAGKNISITFSKSMTKVYVNYFYEREANKPYLVSKLITNPAEVEFQGEDILVHVTSQNEIKNLSDPNKIQSMNIIAFKDGESNLAQNWNSTTKTLTFSKTFDFVIPKGVMDNATEYIQRFISKTEVSLNGYAPLIAVTDGQTKVYGKAAPPEPPEKPKARITINGLTVEDARPQTPAGWWGENTVQMVAGKEYMVYGDGIPGTGQTIESYQWTIGTADYSRSTIYEGWSGEVVYPTSTIGTIQEITLIVRDNLGQSGYAKMYVEVIAPPPKADFIATPNPAYAGNTIQLSNQSIDYYGEAMSALWTIQSPLGDSRVVQTWDAAVENAISGEYKVTLIVENTKGLDQITKTVLVYGPPSVAIKNPTSKDPNVPDILYSHVGVTWKYTEDPLSRKYQRQFEVQIKKAGTETIVKQSGIVNSSEYEWKPSGLESNKTYSVEVRVSDGMVWSEWSEKRYFVYNSQPIADFEAPTIAYQGDTINLLNRSTDADLSGEQVKSLQVLWTIEYPDGDIMTYTDWDLIIPDAERGVYKATLRVNDAYGSWSSTYPKQIRVYGLPSAEIFQPASADPTQPTFFVDNNPIIKWTYQHLDGLSQQKYQVKITTLDDEIIAESGEITSSNYYWKTINLSGGQVYKATVRVFDGYRWGQWSTPKYLQVNQPPVADFISDKESYFEGETITLQNKSYDLDEEPLQMTWDIVDPLGNPRTVQTTTFEDITIPNTREGKYKVTLTVKDPHEQVHAKTEDLFVNSGKVKAVLNVTGTFKVNRKITLDSTASTSPAAYPLLTEKTTFTIIPLDAAGEILPSNNIVGQETADILFKKEGNYKITLTVENALGFNETVEKTIQVVPDERPIAEFTVTQNIYRAPADNNWASMFITDSSYSSDDVIKERTWTFTYNAQNNYDIAHYPIFIDDVSITIKDSELIEDVEQSFTDGRIIYKITKNGNVLTVKVPDVGRYLVELEVVENFAQPTIPAFITEQDYLRDTTVDKAKETKIVTVWNKKPIVDFEY